eukprot:g150.t1
MDDIGPDEAVWQCPVCNNKLHDTEECARGWLRLRQSCPTCRSTAWAPPEVPAISRAVPSISRRRLPRAFSVDAAPLTPQSPSLPEISVAGMNLLRPTASASDERPVSCQEPRLAYPRLRRRPPRPEASSGAALPAPSRATGTRARSLPPREGLALAGLAIMGGAPRTS